MDIYPTAQERATSARREEMAVTALVVALTVAGPVIPFVVDAVWWVRVGGVVLLLPMMAMLSWMQIETGIRAYPPIHPEPRTATVTGTLTLRPPDADGDITLLVVEVDTPTGRFTSVLADKVHDDDFARFDVGSRWRVYEFVRSRERVFLTEEHDDVLRSGHNLNGVRIGWENHPGTGYGSEIIARGFRPYKGARQI